MFQELGEVSGGPSDLWIHQELGGVSGDPAWPQSHKLHINNISELIHFSHTGSYMSGKKEIINKFEI